MQEKDILVSNDVEQTFEYWQPGIIVGMDRNLGTPDKSLKYGLIEPWIGKRNNNRMEMDPPTYHTVHWNDCGDGSLSGLIYLLVGGGPK